MADTFSNNILLVLSGNPFPSGRDVADVTSALTDVMRSASCWESHLFHMSDFQTSSFVWPLLMEFRLPEATDEETGERHARALRSDVMAGCPWLAHDDLRFLWLSQTGFGREDDGVDVIVSLYSWQRSVPPEDRDRNMWTHFDMELEEPDYTAVHFNQPKGSEFFDNHNFDFVFQSYVADPQGLSRIYSNPRLKMMRQHSKSFLDTDTRRLAFGKSQIIRLDSSAGRVA